MRLKIVTVACLGMLGLSSVPASSKGKEYQYSVDQKFVRGGWSDWHSNIKSARLLFAGDLEGKPNQALLVMECRNFDVNFLIRGFTPSQSYPQPAMTISIGDLVISKIPDVSQRIEKSSGGNLYRNQDYSKTPIYRERSSGESEKDEEIATDNLKATARYTFPIQASDKLMDAIISGNPFILSFNGESREIEAPIKEKASNFRDRCIAIVTTVAMEARKANAALKSRRANGR